MKIERISLSKTEASVNSPVRTAPRAKRLALCNTDSPLAPTLKAEQLRRSLATTPMRTATKPTPKPPVVTTPKPSVFKRVLLGIGALVSSVGVVAGLLSMVVLGPIGLAVAAGVGAVGAAMIWLGGKVK